MLTACQAASSGIGLRLASRPEKSYCRSILPWKERFVVAHGEKVFLYEQHALARMRERSVSRAQIEMTVGAPDWTAPADRMTNRVGYEVSISGRDDGTIEAVYVRLSGRKVARSKELIEGQLVADYDRSGGLVGLEILAPVRIQNLTRLVAGPARRPFKRFIEDSMPRDFVAG